MILVFLFSLVKKERSGFSHLLTLSSNGQLGSVQVGCVRAPRVKIPKLIVSLLSGLQNCGNNQ